MDFDYIEINLIFQLDLKLQYETGGDLSNFMENGEWSLLGKHIQFNSYIHS